MEKQMVDLLKELKEKYHVTGVKAEFEAEGTRMEEAMRLKEVSLQAGLGLTIKIGGCEAIKDMFDAASLGVERLIAPMVETPYALKKYLHAAKIAFANGQSAGVELSINVETVTTVQNLDAMLAIPEVKDLKGVVIGRVDLTESMGIGQKEVNSPQVLKIALEIDQKAAAKKMEVVVGGGVSVHSLDFFKSFPPGHLSRFETRKIIFSCPGALNNKEEAFLKAVEFELLWLKNKKSHYQAIYCEDDQRLEMLEKRYRSSISAMTPPSSPIGEATSPFRQRRIRPSAERGGN
jgi:hypothetical protein